MDCCVDCKTCFDSCSNIYFINSVHIYNHVLDKSVIFYILCLILRTWDKILLIVLTFSEDYIAGNMILIHSSYLIDSII